MNEIMKFEFAGNAVRTVMIDDVVWFAGKDIADILGYSDTHKMCQRLDADEKHTADFAVGKNQPLNCNKAIIINESGLYNAVMGSKKPEAKAFKKWVTSEVLPAIRKNGGYMVAIENETTEQLLARALIIANATMDKKNKLIEEQKIVIVEKQEIIEYLEPDAHFGRVVKASTGAITVTDMAHLLTLHGKGIGRNKLHNILQDDLKWTYKSKKIHPYQKHIDRGVIEKKMNDTYTNVYGETFSNFEIMITPKGQQEIIDFLCESTNISSTKLSICKF